ncbi:MAG: Nif11-like leader peptide family RiPP precursor [Myxococcales bacterium]|nr:Nif11-like leader peptide family RiPP precursor [Myxococcales bacterium]
MSKENAVKFLSVVNTNAELHAQIMEKAANVETWVATAKAAGFETTVEDLTQVVEQLVGKSLEGDEVMGALHSLYETASEDGELSESDLAAVAGGVSGLTSTSLQSRLRGLGGGLGQAGYFVREGGPMGVSMPGGGSYSQ